MAKRGRRAKKNRIDINVAVVFMLLISILLGALPDVLYYYLWLKNIKEITTVLV